MHPGRQLLLLGLRLTKVLLTRAALLVHVAVHVAVSSRVSHLRIAHITCWPGMLRRRLHLLLVWLRVLLSIRLHLMRRWLRGWPHASCVVVV